MDSYLEQDLPNEISQLVALTEQKTDQAIQKTSFSLPKIQSSKKKNETNSFIPHKPNLILKLLQAKKSKTHLQKNRSLIEQKSAAIRTMKLQNSIPKPGQSIQPKQKLHLNHIMPRLYQHLQQKDNQNQAIFPRLKPGELIPELESSKVLNEYKIISHVGKGCFSVVSAAVNKSSNRKYAIKTYNRIDQMDDLRLKNIQNQVQNLFHLHHNNIIMLRHAVKDGRKIQLIMQNGGQQSLSGLLRKTTGFQERIAKKYFRQMAEALAYCHSQNICHRDIKLENILVDENDNIKLIDFGFSLKCNNKVRLTSYCGTPPYMSPEIAARSPYNGQTSDVWALGVALYLMLTGKFPFKAGNEKQLYRLIQQGKFKNENLSPEAKSLLQSMLKVDQKGRITADQIMNSSWLASAVL